MTVAFDAVAESAGVGVTSMSYTHTPVGTPTAVGCGVSNYSGATISSITYGATSMGAAVQTSLTGAGRESLYGLANPASGAQQVSVTFSSSGQFAVVGSITVTGSDTTTCFSASAKSSGTSASPAVTVSSAVGELVMASGTDGGTVTVGQTSRWNDASAGLRSWGHTDDGAASVTMTGTLSLSSDWIYAGGSFKDGGAAPSATGWGPLLSDQRNRMVVSA